MTKDNTAEEHAAISDEEQQLIDNHRVLYDLGSRVARMVADSFNDDHEASAYDELVKGEIIPPWVAPGENWYDAGSVTPLANAIPRKPNEPALAYHSRLTAFVLGMLIDQRRRNRRLEAEEDKS